MLVPAGLAAALLAGTGVACVAVICDVDRILQSSAYAPDQLLLFGGLMFVVAGPAFLAAGAVFALIGEAFALRGWVLHILAGGATALLGCRMFSLSGEGGVFGDEAAAAAGLAAGLAYWAVAGRSAGLSDAG